MFKIFLLFVLFFELVIFECSSNDTRPSYPYLSGNTFRAHCDFIYDDTQRNLDPAMVLPGNIVYVKGRFIKSFFQEVHPHIQHPYILLTHNSNYPIPGNFAHYLEDKKIIAWFAVHVKDYIHPKLHPIPVGLPNLSIAPESTRIWDLIRAETGTFQKSIDLYLNFDIKTCPRERQYVYNHFIDKPWCTYSPKKGYELYALDLANSKFVLSPKGIGLDCYRIWESLLAGSIPVIKTSYLDPMYKDLPVLIVDDWDIITPEYLNQKYAEMLLKSYNTDKLFADYWFALIDSYK